MSVEERTQETTEWSYYHPENGPWDTLVSVLQMLGDKVDDQRSKDRELVRHKIENWAEDVATCIESFITVKSLA